MSTFDWVMIMLTVVTALLIPAIVIMVRGAIKWTRTEDKLDTLVQKVGELVSGKDKVHAEILETIRTGQAQTDTRLRYVEEFFMELGRAGIKKT